MSYNLVDPTTGGLTRVAGGIDTSIIPSDASANNKLVAHQTPYNSFTLNNSGSQKWYKLGTYVSGNNTARLDFVSARVDGQMFESSVRISGVGTDSNYVSWIGESGCEISTISIKVDTDRNIYVKMNSYSAVEIRVYGVFTLDIAEQSSEPIGTDIELQKLVTKSDIIASANKIEPNYTEVSLTLVSSRTTKYIKVADCAWNQTGTLQVHLDGNNFVDTLVINFGGGNGEDPMLCGHYSGNSHRVYSVIAQKGSAWNSSYSIYVKVGQETNLTVSVALLKGDCTINISESTTAPTNISEWKVDYGLFGNITSPNLASLEERVSALESKLLEASN